MNVSLCQTWHTVMRRIQTLKMKLNKKHNGISQTNSSLTLDGIGCENHMIHLLIWALIQTHVSLRMLPKKGSVCVDMGFSVSISNRTEIKCIRNRSCHANGSRVSLKVCNYSPTSRHTELTNNANYCNYTDASRAEAAFKTNFHNNNSWLDSCLRQSNSAAEV